MLKWETVTGHYLGAEMKMPWCIHPTLYHYYFSFHDSFHSVEYSLATLPDIAVFVVYNLQEH